MPEVDHLADHVEIVRHLRDLQEKLPAFEVGMSTRFRAWQTSRQVATEAEQAGCAGAILMGLKFETIVDEAALAWNRTNS